jgi:WD40 repeat protein
VNDLVGRRPVGSPTSPGSVVSSPGSMVRVLETARSMPSLSDRTPWLGHPAGVKERALTPSRNRAPAGMGMLEPTGGFSRRASVSRRPSFTGGRGGRKDTGPPSSNSTAQVYPESQQQQDDTLDPKHEFHYRYNRRLECSSQSVAALRFTPDGGAFVSSNTAADIKMWDTKNWSRLARFQNCPDEVLCTVAISISQRWVVCVYPSVVQVYMGHSPNSMVLALPAATSASGAGPVRWASAAFSPTREVDHSHGSAGQDNYLAVLGTGHLRILDYATGWRLGMPGRTVSLMQDANPTCIVFTTDGAWIVCAFSSGQMQVWNASSLCLHKTVSAHSGCVTCLDPSPFEVGTACRVLSCSTDKTLRLWDSFGGNFTLEQHLFDVMATDAGVRQCVFSASCHWVLSVSSEITLYRVVYDGMGPGTMQLKVHQRFNAAQCVENPCAVAFCYTSDAIAMGLRDGTLCLWTKVSGAPAQSQVTKKRASFTSSCNTPYATPNPLGRPLARIQPVQNRLPDIQDQAQVFYQSSPSSGSSPSRQRPDAKVLRREFGTSSEPVLHGVFSTSAARSSGGSGSSDGGGADGALLPPVATTRLMQGQNRPLVKRITLPVQSIPQS